MGLLATGSACAQQAAAGTTLKDRSGWSASLFVPPTEKRSYVEDPNIRLAVPPTVNETISRRLAKRTRLSFDVFNVFDRNTGPVDYFFSPEPWKAAGPTDNYLFGPGEQRGFRLRLRVDF